MRLSFLLNGSLTLEHPSTRHGYSSGGSFNSSLCMSLMCRESTLTSLPQCWQVCRGLLFCALLGVVALAAPAELTLMSLLFWVGQLRR